VPTHAEEMIGVFGWLDTHLPLMIPVLWVALVLAVWVTAVVVGNGRQRVALTLALAVTIVIPIVVEASKAAQNDFFWQGRYSLPLAAGIPVLSVFVLHDRVPRLLTWATLDKCLIGLAAAAHATAFVVVLNRYAVGIPALSTDYLEAPWSPPVDQNLVVCVYLAAITALAVIAVMPIRRIRGRVGASRRLADTGEPPRGESQIART
jgi:hypothetical protein